MSKPTDLEAVQKLCDDATPGPWRWWTSCSFRRLSSDATGKDGDVAYATVHPHDKHPDIAILEGDAAFIDSARTLVPQMAAEIRELRAELAAERARTDALVAALPKCDHCTKAPASPATAAHGRGSKRWCDECVALAKAEPQALAIPNFDRFLPRDYPRAEPLRAIAHARRIAAGGEEKSG